MNTSIVEKPAKPAVLIFRSQLLAYSETFIPAQAEKFTAFTPYYVGYKKLQGLPLPADRTLAPHPRRFVGRARNLAAVFGVIDPWFARSVRHLRPALVHAHFEEGGIGALPLARALGLPLFVTCHGYDVTINALRWHNVPGLGEFYRRRLATLWRQGSRFLGVSRFICDAMIKRGYPAQKVVLHHIGVDAERFSPDSTIQPKSQILYVGRLVEKKGCIDLLKAMVEVGAKYPEISLAVIGDGPLRESLEMFARENRLNVQFLGVKPPAQILEALRESLLFCMPSVRSKSGDSEGLGIVNLEAQAVGLPVVGTWHGGTPEAVENGVTGLLADEHDPAGLARHILTLLGDTSLRLEMGRAGRKRILRDFNLETQSSLLEQHYLEVLKSN